MRDNVLHQYALQFGPILIAAVVFVTQIGSSTDRITESVDRLTVVVQDNTQRSLQNEKEIAVLGQKAYGLRKDVTVVEGKVVRLTEDIKRGP